VSRGRGVGVSLRYFSAPAQVPAVQRACDTPSQQPCHSLILMSFLLSILPGLSNRLLIAINHLLKQMSGQWDRDGWSLMKPSGEGVWAAGPGCTGPRLPVPAQVGGREEPAQGRELLWGGRDGPSQGQGSERSHGRRTEAGGL
jgi:hypothetical protein